MNKTLLISVIAVLVVAGLFGVSYYAGWLDFTNDGDDDACAGVTCGDNVCDADCETIATCQADCLNVCVTETCGNGVCATQCGETISSCRADCDTNVQPPPPEEKLPIESLKANCKNKFTMAAVTTGNISFYTPGADVSDPYVLNLDLVACGNETTNLILQTGEKYDVYYDANGATSYDERIGSWSINYNPETGKGYFLVNGASYFASAPVGTFVAVTSLPEEESGANDSSGTLYYDESALAGSMWWKMDVGNSDANSELRQVVMCFRDNDGDMEGNEVTGLTASYDSGSTAINIPGNLQQYWEDAMGGAGSSCIDIANVLGSAQKARWTFTATISEANFDETGEEFEITFDDVGDYLAKQYPSRNVKATAVTLTIGDQA